MDEKRQTNIMMTPAAHRHLKALAGLEQRSIGGMIERLLAHYHAKGGMRMSAGRNLVPETDAPTWTEEVQADEA